MKLKTGQRMQCICKLPGDVMGHGDIKPGDVVTITSYEGGKEKDFWAQHKHQNFCVGIYYNDNLNKPYFKPYSSLLSKLKENK